MARSHEPPYGCVWVEWVEKMSFAALQLWIVTHMLFDKGIKEILCDPKERWVLVILRCLESYFSQSFLFFFPQPFPFQNGFE